MENKRIAYLVGYSVGEYDDFNKISVFITEDKYKAKKWKLKFNHLLLKWKKHYTEFEDPELMRDGWIRDEHRDKFDRWYALRKTNGAFVNEIEIR